ncbi:MFS transporter [Sphingomonas oligophenolica]|uniref:MFS transporter n=1 Tax=Sphingomonas oligophenolica TaxID=301154 RepID=A0ABU9YBD4_9SPHN
MFVTIGLFSPGLVLPQIASAFAGTSQAPLLTEMIGAIAGFAFALAAPFCGVLTGRLGCRRVILPALLVFALVGSLPALLDNLWLIVASRFVLGVATAAIFTGALAGIGALAAAEQARLFGWFAAVGGVAAILLFPIVGQLGHMGWRPAFLVHLSSLAFVPLVLAIPVTLGRRTTARTSVSDRPRQPAFNIAMAGVLIVAGLTGMSMMLSPIYAPIYLASLGITDTRLASIPLTIGAVAAVLGSFAYGPVNRRIGIMGVFILGTAAMGVALGIAGITRDIYVFTAAIAGMSAMVALLSPNLNAAAVAFSRPERTAQAIGLANGVMFGAQLLFPFVAAWTRALVGLSGVFLVFGIAAAAVALLAGVRRLTAPRPAVDR